MSNKTAEKPIVMPPVTTDAEKWHIAWRNRIDGQEGRGKEEYDTKEACQAECDSCNRIIPYINHWPQSV